MRTAVLFLGLVFAGAAVGEPGELFEADWEIQAAPAGEAVDTLAHGRVAESVFEDPAEEMVAQVPGEIDLRLETLRVRDGARGSRVWSGQPPGAERHVVSTLVRTEAGSVSGVLMSGGSWYMVRPDPDGEPGDVVVRVLSHDREVLDLEGDYIDGGEGESDPDLIHPDSFDDVEPLEAPAEAPESFSIVVGYSTDLVEEYGADGAIAFADGLVEFTNEQLEASGVDFTLEAGEPHRLHIDQSAVEEWVEDSDDWDSYVQTLFRYRAQYGLYPDHHIRPGFPPEEEYRSFSVGHSAEPWRKALVDVDRRRMEDGVHFSPVVTADFPQDMVACGMAFLGGMYTVYEDDPDEPDAWVNQIGHSVTRDGFGSNCKPAEQVFAHELGHNFGSRHLEEGVYEFSGGWRLSDDSVTLMGVYTFDVVELYSNPDLECNGEPCGDPDKADNVRTFNRTAEVMGVINGVGLHFTARGLDDDHNVVLDLEDRSVFEDGYRLLELMAVRMQGTAVTVRLYDGNDELVSEHPHWPLRPAVKTRSGGSYSYHHGSWVGVSLPHDLEPGEYTLEVTSNLDDDLTLSRTAILSEENADISETDPEDRGEVEFTQDTFEVAAEDPYVEVEMERDGGAGHAGVVLETEEGTATAPEHFSPYASVVGFFEGEPDLVTRRIPVLQQPGWMDGEREFEVVLSSYESPEAADVGERDRATVVMLNSEDTDEPEADLSVSCDDLACEFDGSGSESGDWEFSGWELDFGDGNTESGDGAPDVVSHTYADNGEYTAELTVTDEQARSDTVSETIEVYAPPQADLSVSCDELDCEFDASDTQAGAADLATYELDFGDDTTETGEGSPETYSHTFDSDGSYTAELVVEDDEGHEDTTSTSFFVTVDDDDDDEEDDDDEGGDDNGSDNGSGDSGDGDSGSSGGSSSDSGCSVGSAANDPVLPGLVALALIGLLVRRRPV